MKAKFLKFGIDVNLAGEYAPEVDDPNETVTMTMVPKAIVDDLLFVLGECKKRLENMDRAMKVDQPHLAQELHTQMTIIINKAIEAQKKPDVSTRP